MTVKVSFTFETLRNDLFGMDLDLTEEEYEKVCHGELPESVMAAWRKKHRKAQINDWAACDYGTWKDIRPWRYA